jgi:endonuclease/exonuclease/phosphatase (EEP) superfamily protein YafD
MARTENTMAWLIFVAMLTLSVPLVAGFFGTLHPALDSFGHFRVHLAVLMALCAVPLLTTSFRPQAAMALLFAVAALVTTSNALSLSRLWQAHAAYETKPDGAATYRLLQMNLRFNNPTPEKVLSLIGRTQPDVITLEETSDMWQEKLASLTSTYPYRILCPYLHGRFGVGLLSRRPFAAGTVSSCDPRGAMAVATVDFEGTDVDVAAIHLTWPWPRRQYRQIGGLSKPLASLGETALVAGDCNAAPWSAAVRRVAGIGRLTVMPSVGPTWLYIKLPDFLRFAGLPIDQVFSKGAVIIHSATRLEDTGSDHLPVMVEFSLTPQERKPVNERASATASPRRSRRDGRLRANLLERLRSRASTRCSTCPPA